MSTAPGGCGTCCGRCCAVAFGGGGWWDSDEWSTSAGGSSVRGIDHHDLLPSKRMASSTPHDDS